MRRNPSERRDFGPTWPEVPQGLGLAPTSGIFQVSAEAGTWKIRKCIDTCIACRLAQAPENGRKTVSYFAKTELTFNLKRSMINKNE